MQQVIKYKIVAEKRSYKGLTYKHKELPYWEEPILSSIYVSTYEALTRERALLVERDARLVELEELKRILKEDFGIIPEENNPVRVYDNWFRGQIIPERLKQNGLTASMLVDVFQKIGKLMGVSYGYIAQDSVKEAGYVNASVFEDVAKSIGKSGTDVLKELAEQGYIVRYKGERHGYLVWDRISSNPLEKLRLSDDFKGIEQKLRLRLRNLLPSIPKIQIGIKRSLREATGRNCKVYKNDIAVFIKLLKALYKYSVCCKQLEYINESIPNVIDGLMKSTTREIGDFVRSSYLNEVKASIEEISAMLSSDNNLKGAESSLLVKKLEATIAEIKTSQAELLQRRQNRPQRAPRIMVPTSHFQEGATSEQLKMRQNYYPRKWKDLSLAHSFSLPIEAHFDLNFQAFHAMDASIISEIKDQTVKMPMVLNLLEKIKERLEQEKLILTKKSVMGFEDRILSAIKLISQSPLLEKNTARLELEEALVHLRNGKYLLVKGCVDKAIAFIRTRIDNAQSIRENLNKSTVEDKWFIDLEESYGLTPGSIIKDLKFQGYLDESGQLLCYPKTRGFKLVFSDVFYLEVKQKKIYMKKFKSEVLARLRSAQQGRLHTMRVLTDLRNSELNSLCIKIKRAIQNYSSQNILDNNWPTVNSHPFITLLSEINISIFDVGIALNNSPHLKEPEFGLSFYASKMLHSFLDRAFNVRKDLQQIVVRSNELKQDILRNEQDVDGKENRLATNRYNQRTRQNILAEVEGLKSNNSQLQEQLTVIEKEIFRLSEIVKQSLKEAETYVNYIAIKTNQAKFLSKLMAVFRTRYEKDLLEINTQSLSSFKKEERAISNQVFGKTWLDFMNHVGDFSDDVKVIDGSKESNFLYGLFYFSKNIHATVEKEQIIEGRKQKVMVTNPLFLAAQELLAILDSNKLSVLLSKDILSENVTEFLKSANVNSFASLSRGFVSEDIFAETLANNSYTELSSKAIRGALVHYKDSQYLTRDFRLIEMPTYDEFKTAIEKRLWQYTKDKTKHIPEKTCRDLYEKLQTITNQVEDACIRLGEDYNLSKDEVVSLVEMTKPAGR